MKKFITAATVVGLSAGAIAGADFNVDFATAHVFRGATVTDELVVQPNVELDGFGMDEKYGNIALGVWGSTAPFDDNGANSYDSIYETDWYINYALPEFVEGLDLYIGYIQYQYSQFSGINEKELGIGAGYELGGFMLGASANFMLDDRNPFTEEQKYFDFTADYAFDISEDFELSAGGLLSYMIQGKGNAGAIGGFLDDGFNHYELYADAGYALGEMWSLGASLAYVGQFSSDVLPNFAYDKGLVLMFSVGCEM